MPLPTPEGPERTRGRVSLGAARGVSGGVVAWGRRWDDARGGRGGRGVEAFEGRELTRHGGYGADEARGGMKRGSWESQCDSRG